MSLHRLTLPALALVGIALPALAGEPRPLVLQQEAVSLNHDIAHDIARQMRASGHLQNYRIDISFGAGVAELSGTVADAHQRDEALRLAHSVPGVNIVRNRLTVAAPVSQVRLGQDQPLMPSAGDEPLGTPMQDPLPSYRAPVPTYSGQTLPPPMPPYAWPTYAPHNNFSRVAYPESYPNQAFPFIGPVYPFPKAPLGWRKVTLEFDDGHWWLSNHAQQRDWWFLRYW